VEAKYLIAVLVLPAILALISGCRGGDSGLEIKLAPIHEVEISITESFPEQILVHITGGLADGCTVFHELSTERIDNTIKIEVTTERPRDAFCVQVYGYFEKYVNLGSDFANGVIYTVDVNGTIRTFEYPPNIWGWSCSPVIFHDFTVLLRYSIL